MDLTSHAKIGTRAHLRLLATSDLHMHLTGHDYYSDRPDPTVGLTRTASLIRTARSEAAQDGALTLLFDNGDSLQGSPLGDLAIEQPDRPHPMMRAFGHLGYDAIGLGNHDFNFGLEALDAVLAQAPCPVLCSNLRRLDATDPQSTAPFVVLDRSVQVDGAEFPIRIGVLSFLPPQTVRWDAHLLAGRIEVDDIVDSARHWVPGLRRAGCDVIVALAHSGLTGTPLHQGMENAVLPLAALDGIDAIIAGHTHLLLPGTDHSDLDEVCSESGMVLGKPVVMPGTAGSHLGVIDLKIIADGNGHWSADAIRCGLRPISTRGTDGSLASGTEEDQELSDLLASDHAAIRKQMRQPVGHIKHPLHSYFSFFAPDRALATVAAAQAAALRKVLVGTDAAGLPLLSATAPCKFGGRSGPLNYTDIPAGAVSMRHVADLHLFPNQLSAVIATGQQVLDWLEMSASLFCTIIPGSTGMTLIDPDMPGHDFDVLHGITWQIDLSVPPRFHLDGTLRRGNNRRICNLSHQGHLVTMDQRFVVALNSYRANGGGQIAALADVEHLQVPPMNIRDILRDYLSDGAIPDPICLAPSPWKFRAMPGTRVSALTGPGARTYLSAFSNGDIQDDGLDSNGFLRLILSL